MDIRLENNVENRQNPKCSAISLKNGVGGGVFPSPYL